MLTQEQFTRNFSVMADGEVDFFLGAGASIASGIPTGRDLIWTFKRTLYCSEHGESTEKYKDMALPSTREKLQAYFDSERNYPKLDDPNEYSYYFEQCYSDPLARKRFIDAIVTGHDPSVGYFCLAELIHHSRIKNVWTTNFDPLIENAIHTLYPQSNVLVCSEANRDSIHHLNPQYPVIGKLHGDYRYDWLRNTNAELQQLESNIIDYAKSQLMDKQLVVIGYSGNDESIMSFLESNIDDPSFLSKGLLWAIRKGGYINPGVRKLIDKVANAGKHSDLIEISSFDSVMYALFQIHNYKNDYIQKQQEVLAIKSKLRFTGNSVDSFVKLNGYRAESLLQCNVFSTDITSWKALKMIVQGSDIIAALYKGHIYSFSSASKLKEKFTTHVLSSISMETVPEWIIRRNDSIYIGLLYDLIGKTMNEKGLERIGKKRFYNPKSIRIDKGFEVYDALEMAISFIDGALYLNLLPTVHVRGKNGIKLDSETYKAQINRIVSSIYNRQYNENLRTWERMFLSSGKFVFENEGFILSFITPAISCGGIRRERHWLSFPSYMFPEPVMCYSDSDQSKRAINQLKGLCQYGPIDYSYSQKDTSRLTVRLAVFAPRQDMRKILEHLNNLNTTTANTGKDIFLPNYEGFERIYHRALLVPSENNKICIGYDREEQLKNSPQGFLDFMKRAIGYYSRHTFDFDVLVIYIPRSFALFRTSEAISTDFNLHDALKLYATEHGVKIQIIEEKSIGSYYPCKVMWGLSTSLFAKASGVLWHPKAIQNDTAYIGISYAYSEEKGICIGCSQLFDSTGTGIRMVLRKIDNPLFRGKSNPYMRADDARAMMTELREQYYRSNPLQLSKTNCCS